jgi:hypothetical protein
MSGSHINLILVMIHVKFLQRGVYGWNEGVINVFRGFVLPFLLVFLGPNFYVKRIFLAFLGHNHVSALFWTLFCRRVTDSSAEVSRLFVILATSNTFYVQSTLFSSSKLCRNRACMINHVKQVEMKYIYIQLHNVRFRDFGGVSSFSHISQTDQIG